MVRPRVLRKVEQEPPVTYYKPQGIPMTELSEVTLSLEGFEAVRLIDYLGYDQERAAQEMGVSKATFCRVLGEARRIIATALTEGHALRISGGDYILEGQAPVPAHCRKTQVES